MISGHLSSGFLPRMMGILIPLPQGVYRTQYTLSFKRSFLESQNTHALRTGLNVKDLTVNGVLSWGGHSGDEQEQINKQIHNMLSRDKRYNEKEMQVKEPRVMAAVE